MAELSKKDEDRLRAVETYITKLDATFATTNWWLRATGALVLLILGGVGFLIWQFVETRTSVAVHAQKLSEIQRSADDAKEKLTKLTAESKVLSKEIDKSINEAVSRIKLETVPSNDQYVAFLLSKKHIVSSDKNRLVFQWPLVQPIPRDKVKKSRMITNVASQETKDLADIPTQVYGVVEEDGSKCRIVLFSPGVARIEKFLQKSGNILFVDGTISTFD